MPKHEINPDKWIDLYSDYLFNYTISRVNDREIAQDLISETFLAGLKSMKNFKGQASERTWLISILKRKIIDHYRKINSNKDSELGDAIQNCLDKLPQKQAQIFKMKTIQNYETEVICNELNITASNLWVIIHRARTAMADCLKENWF